MTDEKLIDEAIENLPETAKVIYKKSPDYNIVYVNGVYGGLTGKGELRFDFFQEFHPFPDEETLEITDEGKLGNPILPDEDSEQFELIREKQFGVVMSMNFAQSLYQWLEDKLEAYERIKANLEGERNEQGYDDC